MRQLQHELTSNQKDKHYPISPAVQEIVYNELDNMLKLNVMHYISSVDLIYAHSILFSEINSMPKKYSVTEKECLAALSAIKRFRP